MPIKFRCQSCRQFLGISRSKAGQIVDCPTCGRATRVPNLDGSREPVPSRPELDSADSSLMSALDQLAELGRDAPRPEARPDTAATASAEAHVEAHESAEPIALQPLAPVEVVEPPQTEPGLPGTAPRDATEDSADVLQKLAATASGEADQPAVDGPATPAALLIGALVGGLGLAFAAGWWFGGQQSAQPERQPVAEKGKADQQVGSGVPAAIDGIAGRVTYRRAESPCVADRGSRVIAWPVEGGDGPLLDSDGFRAGDPEQSTADATKKLKEAGGVMAIVDKDGLFQAPLPSGGDYEVLVLSRFGGRLADDAGMSPAHLARLKTRFSDPLRLVGRTQFRLFRLKYRGEGQQLLDHVFEVAD